MLRAPIPRLQAFVLLALTLATVTGGVWWFALTSGVEQVARRGESDLALAADRLTGQLARFRELAVLLADHPALVARLRGQIGAEPTAATLTETADQTGSLEIALLDATGRGLSASDGAAVPGDLSHLPHVARALGGALGIDHGIDAARNRRIFTFAAPVFVPDGPVEGVVLVTADIEAIEAEWRGDGMAVFFTDQRGVVFATNRSEMLLSTRPLDPPPVLSTREYGGLRLAPFTAHEVTRLAGHEIWQLPAPGPYLPARAVHLTRPLPAIGMTGEALAAIGPARRMALLQATVAGAVVLVFGVLLWGLSERRRALSDRLAIEARANAALEARVSARTAELSAANTRLRREVAERQEAEARLKQAQADLVQAGKLSALGQMSAGISHELNQPLMAIGSFSENAVAYLERGQPDIARQNLDRIADLSRRMGRIIKNLRAFARQEREPIRSVDLGAVVGSVLELTEARLAATGVALHWVPPPAPVLVRGGEVRLQQVVMNLVSNALDAMEGRPARQLHLAITPGNPVTLSVRDTGPGIAAPDRIFDPFYSTKEVGGSEGMGLGLSISYGLVQSFGGAIRGANHPEGGALFTVELTPACLETAA